MNTRLPRSIAIAGAWGYIGRKFLDVALAEGLTTFVFDPGPIPPDVDASRLTRIEDVQAFSQVPSEVFHLAVHPEHRRLDLLLNRAEPCLILNEKPMAVPGDPEACQAMVESVEHSKATVLYDFPELYDPITDQILDRLNAFKTCQILEIRTVRSKDREDPSKPRNHKRMVSIQYQETVHCLAFSLFILSRLQGSTQNALADGIRIEGESSLYVPPNPELYPEPVDGRCRYQASLGSVLVQGLTDFKSGAPLVKKRLIRGVGDGQPFEIEASYLEGKKWLWINGEEQPCDPLANSYQHVLIRSKQWMETLGRDHLQAGVYPNPAFTLLTYQLSSALWQSCQSHRAIEIRDEQALRAWRQSIGARVRP